MKQKLFLLLFMVSIFITISSCNIETEESDIINYVTFSSTNYDAGAITLDGSVDFEISILSSLKTNSARTFNINVDNNSSNAGNGSYSVPNTVTIPSGSQEGKFTITLSDVDLGIGVNDLVLNFSEKEGVFFGDSTTISYTQQCTETTVTLEIIFDDFASETGYEITDSLGSIIASANPETWSDGDTSAIENISLCANRDYTFTITDSFGDGITYPNTGSYSLRIGDETKASGSGNFEASKSTDFDTN